MKLRKAEAKDKGEVPLVELEPGSLFESPLGSLFVRSTGDKSVRLGDGAMNTYGAFIGSSCYRARIISVDPDGTLVWERVEL